jgi:hypothetical protein
LQEQKKSMIFLGGVGGVEEAEEAEALHYWRLLQLVEFQF